MNRQVLFIQGAGAGTHDEWDNKLVESLSDSLGPDYDIRYPRIPNDGDAAYDVWKAALEPEFAALDYGALLVGHSVGAAVLIKAIAEGTPAHDPGALFLIAAPFFGDGGWPSDDFMIPRDAGLRLPSVIHFYHGLKDGTVPASHTELYERMLPQAHFHRLPGRDHQLNNDLREIATAFRSPDVDVKQTRRH
jgi:predicted alpha/beta hydrolase family esterase